MTRKELEKTAWAKHFKKYSPISYSKAIELAMTPNLPVRIYKTDETGEYMWAIESVLIGDFWMDAFRYKKHAVELCKKMGWRYKPAIADE